MPPAARLFDQHVCPMPGTPPHVGGPVTGACSADVIIGGQPAARVADLSLCTAVGIPDPIVQGSPSVFINRMPAARIGDRTAHGGTIITGCPTVMIGDAGGGGGTAAGARASKKGKQGPATPISPLASGEAIVAPIAQSRALQRAAASGAAFVEPCPKAGRLT